MWTESGFDRDENRRLFNYHLFYSSCGFFPPLFAILVDHITLSLEEYPHSYMVNLLSYLGIKHSTILAPQAEVLLERYTEPTWCTCLINLPFHVLQHKASLSYLICSSRFSLDTWFNLWIAQFAILPIVVILQKILRRAYEPQYLIMTSLTSIGIMWEPIGLPSLSK